ncbi:DUF817 family protein, partial [Streptomyces longwoodensis]|uniref:DUF817 family protein n=1 Tax=Streptomyces longwoodensis TaxID=68231 RepID=UPI0033D9B5E4
RPAATAVVAAAVYINFFTHHWLPDVRLPLAAQGEFLPRWDGDLALDTAGRNAGAHLVVTVRDGTPGQRWLTDAGAARRGSLSVSGTGGPTARPARAPGHNA